jgi:hypothetical protein
MQRPRCPFLVSHVPPSRPAPATVSSEVPPSPLDACPCSSPQQHHLPHPRQPFPVAGAALVISSRPTSISGVVLPTTPRARLSASSAHPSAPRASSALYHGVARSSACRTPQTQGAPPATCTTAAAAIAHPPRRLLRFTCITILSCPHAVSLRHPPLRRCRLPWMGWRLRWRCR